MAVGIGAIAKATGTDLQQLVLVLQQVVLILCLGARNTIWSSSAIGKDNATAERILLQWVKPILVVVLLLVKITLPTLLKWWPC
ncbi:MAG: hypothetical protein ACLRZ2_05220 [Veillonella sp.]